MQAKVGILNDTTDVIEYKVTGFFDYSTPTTVYFYNDTAPTNWTIVSGVGDTVLAAKGGSTYTTGGSKQGTWTISGMSTESHTHPWYYQASSYGYTYNSAGTLTAMTTGNNVGENTYAMLVGVGVDNWGYREPSNAYSEVVEPTVGNYFYAEAQSHTHTHGGTWRPAGALGIIAQYDG